MDIKENLKYHRNLNNMTQEELAKKSGISRPHIGAIESGKQSTTIKTIQKLATALNISVETLTSKKYSSDESLYKLVSKLILGTQNSKIKWEDIHNKGFGEKYNYVLDYFVRRIFRYHKSNKNTSELTENDYKTKLMQDLGLENPEIIKLAIESGAFCNEFYESYNITDNYSFMLITLDDENSGETIIYLGYTDSQNNFQVLGGDTISSNQTNKMLTDKISSNLKDLRLTIKNSISNEEDIIENLINSLDFDLD